MRPIDVYHYYQSVFGDRVVFLKDPCWAPIYEIDIETYYPEHGREPKAFWSSNSSSFFQKGKFYAIKIDFVRNKGIKESQENLEAEVIALEIIGLRMNRKMHRELEERERNEKEQQNKERSEQEQQEKERSEKEQEDLIMKDEVL